MKSIILAAGMGSRLRPLTFSVPKCLVPVADKPILEYQINALSRAGIKDITIVIGYLGDLVISFVRKWMQENENNQVNVSFIENPFHRTTNNMYSLYLARNEFYGRSFILLNGDVVLSEEIIRNLVLNKENDLVCVDTSVFFEESMKVTIDENGYISNISKSISREMAYGVSIDVYKFSDESSKLLLDMVVQIVEQEKNLREWTEVAMQRLFYERKLKMRPYDIKGLKWFEVDTPEDLEAANVLFKV
ncbi:MAG: phosphocholine cytidylyltransferase family protein [Archaeoglobaceae archaeon]